MNGIFNKLALTFFVLATGFTGYAEDGGALQERVGEAAKYKLDRSRQRTTGMIKRGEVDTLVADYNEQDPNGPSYLVDLKYNLKVSFVGRKQGQLGLSATEAFFQPEYMEDLRKAKELEEPKFKIRHLGYGDAKLKGGMTYPNCDIVEIYEIDTTTANSFSLFGLAQSILQEAANATFQEEPQIAESAGGGGTTIEDMVIKAYVCANIPVIGAAKIDMKGKTSGYNFKAGFDYVTP